MNREEKENVLQEVLTNILLGNGINHTIRIVLSDGTVFDGFRIIENNKNYILGFTNQQRINQVNSLSFIPSTIIPKNNIAELHCPELWKE